MRICIVMRDVVTMERNMCVYIYKKCVLVFRGCLMETMMMFDEFRRYDKLYVEKRKSSRVGRSVCMHTT